MQKGPFDLFTRSSDIQADIRELLIFIAMKQGALPGTPGEPPAGVPVVTNYISEQAGDFNSGTLNSTITFVQSDVEAALGRPAAEGYVYAQAGNLHIKINNGDTFTLDAGNAFLVGMQNRILAVKKIHITPATAGGNATFRLFLC